MGWAHPPVVAMEEERRLVRGFVDVLVLAGGRTSSGAAATWSADEIKKALRWALFFEEVSGDPSRLLPFDFITSSPFRFLMLEVCRISCVSECVRDMSPELLHCACIVFRFSRTCSTRASTRILQENSMRHSLSSLQVPSSLRCFSIACMVSAVILGGFTCSEFCYMCRVLLLYVQICYPWQGCWLCDIF